MTPKKPNSAMRHVAKVRMYNKPRVTCRMPGSGYGAVKFNRVLVRGGRANDLPGVGYSLVRGVYDFAPRYGKKRRRSFYGLKRPEHLVTHVRRKVRQREALTAAKAGGSMMRLWERYGLVGSGFVCVLTLWGLNLLAFGHERYCRSACARAWEAFSTSSDAILAPAQGLGADLDGTTATDSEDLLIFAADTFEFVAQDAALATDLLGALTLPGAGALALWGRRLSARFLK